MFVLGIDPGLSRCGYGVLSTSGSTTKAVSAGVIRTDPKTELPRRLSELQTEVTALIAEFTPSVVAIERVLFQVNVQTAMMVGQASGVVMATAATAGCEVVEFSPNEVKASIAGYGNATKDQVEHMVQRLLGIKQPLRPVDAADAVAIALAYLAQSTVLVRGAR